jgi:pantetheine-phosphate adenylyltransferase
VRTALYPGTFDPITCGHVDIVQRAARIFDRVVVAVADTPAKSLLFDTTERVGLAREALGDLPNVEVQPYKGLTVHKAAELGACIVRGLRAFADFENELQMTHQNRRLRPDVETIFLPTSLEYSFLSSSLLKDVARHGGDVSGLVPGNVARALRERLGQS